MSSQGVPVSLVKPFVQLCSAVQSNATWGSVMEGRIFTLIDAMISDKEQREAFKSLARTTVRGVYDDINRNIERTINHFTEAFEGEKIEYTTFQNDLGEWMRVDHKAEGKDNSPRQANMFNGK